MCRIYCSVQLFLYSLCGLVNTVICGSLDFPPGFKFGAATSAYQVEGAWNVSGKGESIWDTVAHQYPHDIGDRSSGDVAADSYHLWERDVQIAEELGLHIYSKRLTMGNYKSKEEKDNVVIQAMVTNHNEVEQKLTMFGWMLIAIMIVMAVLGCYFLKTRCRNKAKSWLRRQIVQNTQQPPIVTVHSAPQPPPHARTYIAIELPRF